MTRTRGTALLLVFLFLGVSGHSEESGKARLEGKGNGLQTATFDTLSGSVTVNLPEEIAPGDTISGTVVAEPAGDNEKKREENLGVLTGYVLDLADQRGGVGDGRLTVAVPEDKTRSAATLVLRELRKGKPGREIGRVDLPVRELPEPPEGFRLPTIAQTGRPLVVRGRFDGDLSGTGLKVGETAALPLCESPRLAVFRSPETTVGRAPVTLHEQGRDVASGELRNVDVRLSAPKLDLSPGEATTLTTIVSGLEKLDEEVPLTLDVWPAAVVNVEGGHHHDLTIRPRDVDTAGTYRLDLAVTGQVVGRWTAQASVVVPEPSMADRFVLFLEGDPMGYVQAVSGGTISPGPTIRFDAGLGLERPFYHWLNESFASGPVRMNGAIVGVDRGDAEREVHRFHQAYVESVSFPALDVDDKSPAYMTIEIAPERVDYRPGDGSKSGAWPSAKKWLCSNFRFEIGDLPVARVSKIDSFTWKQGLSEDEAEDLKVIFSTEDLFAWEGWHRAFTGSERAAGGALDGRLVLLGTDRDSELAAIELRDASAASAAVGPGGCTVEIVNSRLTFLHGLEEEVP